MKVRIYFLVVYFLMCASSAHANNFLEDFIARTNPTEAKIISERIRHYSEQYGVDFIFVTAVFKNESNFRMEALSSVNAIGIAQLMPETARELQVNPYVLDDNIRGGVKYLAFLLQHYAHKGEQMPNFALAGYNAGYGLVDEINGIPNYAETINYIAKVHNTVIELRALSKNSNYNGELKQNNQTVEKKKPSLFFDIKN